MSQSQDSPGDGVERDATVLQPATLSQARSMASASQSQPFRPTPSFKNLPFELKEKIIRQIIRKELASTPGKGSTFITAIFRIIHPTWVAVRKQAFAILVKEIHRTMTATNEHEFKGERGLTKNLRGLHIIAPISCKSHAIMITNKMYTLELDMSAGDIETGESVNLWDRHFTFVENLFQGSAIGGKALREFVLSAQSREGYSALRTRQFGKRAEKTDISEDKKDIQWVSDADKADFMRLAPSLRPFEPEQLSKVYARLFTLIFGLQPAIVQFRGGAKKTWRWKTEGCAPLTWKRSHYIKCGHLLRR